MALKEVCIAARDFGPGRAKEGDIITIRNPKGGIGLKEGRDFLWLLMDEADVPIHTPKKHEGRLNVSLDEIKQRHPSVNLDRVRDPNDEYQPFLNTDPETKRNRGTVRTARLTITDRRQQNGVVPS